MCRLGVILLAAGALLVTPAATAVRKNPCVLVTARDASKALGGAVGAGKEEKLRLFDSCTYTRRRKTVVVKTRQISKASFQQSAKRIPGTSLKVTGIGEEAWVAFVPRGISLYLWQHRTEVVFQVLGTGSNASTVVRDLAKTAVSRI
jgi:hypothetical protein